MANQVSNNMNSEMAPTGNVATGNGRTSFGAWIRAALTDEHVEGKPTHMVLMHMVGMQQEELKVVKFDGRAWSPNDLASIFRSEATAFSQDLQGPQMFHLFVFYDGSPEPQRKFPFMIQPNNDTGGRLSTESPDATGLVQQAQRHAEMIMQQTYRRQQSLDNVALNLIERLGSELESKTQENREMFLILRDTAMKQVTEDRTHEMKVLEHERSSAERKKILTAAPALINTIVGKEIFPQSTADTSLVDTLMDAIEPEKIMMLTQMLPQEAGALLMSRFEHRMKQREEEAKKKAEALALAPRAGNTPQDGTE